jgi:hypothetical protein
MRDEAQRIASLKTGDEKVTSAEVFTQAAGELDEAIARAARDDEQPDT